MIFVPGPLSTALRFVNAGDQNWHYRSVQLTERNRRYRAAMTAHIELFGEVGDPLRSLARRSLSLAFERVLLQPGDRLTVTVPLPFVEQSSPRARDATVAAFTEVGLELGATVAYTAGASSLTFTRSEPRVPEGTSADDSVTLQQEILEQLRQVNDHLSQSVGLQRDMKARIDDLSVADWLAILAFFYTLLSHIFAATPAR